MYRSLPPALLAVALASQASAQWASDTTVNQAVSNAPSDQNQTKIVATPDGGFWVSWFDGIGTGWDVRVQKLDVAGREGLATGGALVADRSFSSTQDYGLAVARNGDALLAFRDDRSGSTEVTAARFTAQGSAAWGTSGIQLTSSVGFVAAPKIAAANDGGAFVAWTENATVRVQRLDAAGAAAWGPGVTLTPAVGSYGLADLHASGAGVILSIAHQTGNFGSPRHLVAQRFDATGTPQWGATPLAVFDGGSLQFGNFPAFTVDESGGAIFAWYSSSPSLQCFAQRVDVNGTEQWPHNGVEVATAPGMLRVNPYGAFDPITDEVVVAWIELNAQQSMSGVSLQRVDASGARLWSNAGMTLVPVGSAGTGSPQVFPGGPGGDTLVTWTEEPTFAASQVFGARLDSAGSISAPRFDVASTPSGKARFASAHSAAGFVLLGWSDARSDGGDIYVQALAADGTPGGTGALTDSTCAGVPNSTGLAAELVATGTDVAAANDVTLWATNLPAGSFGYFLTSDSFATVGQPGGSQGLLCLGGSIGRYVGAGQIKNSGPAGTFSLVLDLTQHPTPTGSVTVMGGQTWYFQAWHRDANPSSTSNFTSGLRVDFL